MPHKWKSYVGFDSSWPHRRVSHERNAANGFAVANGSKRELSPFNAALREYGIGNFDWQILYQSHDWNHCLNYAEPILIKEHQGMTRGYNRHPGGAIGNQHPKGMATSKCKQEWINYVDRFRNEPEIYQLLQNLLP